MPDPTREQFEAAAAKVMASAPDGTSREQFFALIDAEIERGVAQSNHANPAPAPSALGFIGNAAKDAVHTASGIIDAGNAALKDPIGVAAGLPGGIWSRIKQIGSDIHPGEAMTQLGQGNPIGALSNLLPVGEAYQRPVQMAADAAGAGGMVKAGIKLAKLPTAARQAGLASRVDRFMPNKSTYSDDITGKGGPKPPTPSTTGSTMAPGYVGNETPPARPRQVPASAPTSAPPAHPDPQFAPIGGEAAHNATRPNAAAVNVDDTMYREMLDKLGGEAKVSAMDDTVGRPPAPTPPNARPKADFDDVAERVTGPGGIQPERRSAGPRTPSETAMTPDAAPGSGDWHAFPDDEARAAADPAERASANALHRETGEMDSRFRNVIDDEAGMVPSGLPYILTRMLAEEALRQARAAVPPGGVVSRTASAAKSATKAATKVSNIGRMSHYEDDDKR